jgi:hypothetical protein
LLKSRYCRYPCRELTDPVMRPFRRLRRLALLILPLTLAATALAQGTADIAQDPRALRAEAKGIRQAAAERFKRESAACRDKFMVNDCIDSATEARIAELQRARGMEAEASRMERDARQRALEDKRAAKADSAPARAADVVDADGNAAAVEAARKASAQEAAERAARKEALVPQRTEELARERAEREAAVASRRAQEEAAAAERARQAERDRAAYEEKIRAYEKKQAEKAERDASDQAGKAGK